MTKSRDGQDDQKKVHDPGRRKFLKGVGIAGAGAAIADHLWIEADAEEKQSTPEVGVGNRQSCSQREWSNDETFRLSPARRYSMLCAIISSRP